MLTLTDRAVGLPLLDGLSADRVDSTFLEIMAEIEFAHIYERVFSFSTLTVELCRQPRLFTYVDLFCGAGGSSIGLTMAGGLLLFAANHSKRAIETHSINFPNAEHRTADLNHYDMRNIPAGADVLWASPICTEISPAGGRKRSTKTDSRQLELLREGPVDQDTFERTRATFHDVIRATEVHRFKYVLVENVVEAVVDWKLFAWWLGGMVILGYQWQLLCVSAAHVGGPLNPHAPQRRDRIYLVFNRSDCPQPDIAPRPLSLCPTCGDVAGVQWWKRPRGTVTASGERFFVGKYGPQGQYLYRCPNEACRHAIVTPYERPAAAVIDWTDLGIRIGDRTGKDKLKPNTLRRIEAGLRIFGRPITATVAGNTYERPESGYLRAWPADTSPFMTRTTTGSDALATPAVLVNSTHDDDRAYPADATPFPARTTKIGDGVATLVDPPGGAFLVSNYSDAGRPQDRVRPAERAGFGSVTTGRNHALVTPPGALVDTARQHATPRPVQEPFTVVAAGGNHHGLVIPYYRTGKARSTREAFPTVTTVDGFGLLPGEDGDIDVMEAHYRMVQWHEQARAQRFPRNYTITGNNGERTAQAGNAVPCNVAQFLGERVAEALNRTAANV